MTGRIPSRPLTGGDYFALALDHDMRRTGMAGALCRLVVEVGGALGADQLRSALRASGLEPWLSAVRSRRLLPFLKPRWRPCGRPGGPPITEQAAREAWDPAAPDRFIEAHCSPRRFPGFAFDLVRQEADKTALVFTWHHGLMDAHGAELLLRQIGTRGSPPDAATLFGNPPSSWRELLLGWLHWRRDLRAARRSLALVDEASRPPILSLVPRGHRHSASSCRREPVERRAGPRSRFRLIPFTREETALLQANSDRAGAAFRRSLFCLAAAIRALDGVRLRRGAPPATYLVPVPQDRRRRGATGPVFSNHLSFLFYRGAPDAVATMESLVAALVRQMTAQVRDRMPEAFATAMEMFQRVPLSWYARILHGPSGGQFASLFFSDTGEVFREQAAFLGAPILGVTHLAPVCLPPGIAVVCSTFQGRLSLVLSWLEGCLDDTEAALVEQILRRELMMTSA